MTHFSLNGYPLDAMPDEDDAIVAYVAYRDRQSGTWRRTFKTVRYVQGEFSLIDPPLARGATEFWVVAWLPRGQEKKYLARLGPIGTTRIEYADIEAGRFPLMTQ